MNEWMDGMVDKANKVVLYVIVIHASSQGFVL
jgi:hypothetical protein